MPSTTGRPSLPFLLTAREDLSDGLIREQAGKKLGTLRLATSFAAHAFVWAGTKTDHAWLPLNWRNWFPFKLALTGPRALPARTAWMLVWNPSWRKAGKGLFSHSTCRC